MKLKGLPSTINTLRHRRCSGRGATKGTGAFDLLGDTKRTEFVQYGEEKAQGRSYCCLKWLMERWWSLASTATLVSSLFFKIQIWIVPLCNFWNYTTVPDGQKLQLLKFKIGLLLFLTPSSKLSKFWSPKEHLESPKQHSGKADPNIKNSTLQKGQDAVWLTWNKMTKDNMKNSKSQLP